MKLMYLKIFIFIIKIIHVTTMNREKKIFFFFFFLDLCLSVQKKLSKLNHFYFLEKINKKKIF